MSFSEKAGNLRLKLILELTNSLQALCCEKVGKILFSKTAAITLPERRCRWL